MIANELVGLVVETGLKESAKAASKIAARIAAGVAAEGVALTIVHFMNENRVPMKDIPVEDQEKVANGRIMRNAVVRGACQFAAYEALNVINGKIEASGFASDDTSTGLI